MFRIAEVELILGLPPTNERGYPRLTGDGSGHQMMAFFDRAEEECAALKGAAA
jgi:hypothetical protein